MSGSSFQSKSDLDLEDIWANTAALYSLLKQGEPHNIRRAELKQGVCASDPVDFIADFEMRLRRVLNPVQYRMTLRYVTEERYLSVPKAIQRLLGKLFLETDMDASGAYRVLFFKAKNARLQDHEQGLQFPEESQ
jgi:hypothetical protein